ncbi:MAG: hypothetical protein RL001_827 [Pseudomonadota bacterium]|jgi:uncharacterized protein YigA (DUF484 family)
MTQAIDAHAVALYLEDHPQFFDQHPDLIAGLKLTTALGGRTVSLHERQVEVLREKVRQLELKLGNQGHVARDNQAIMEKFQQWVLRLLSADDGREPNSLLASVRDCFDVPAASLRLWGGANNDDIWHQGPELEEARAWANQHTRPYCGAPSGKPGVQWLENAGSMQSIALLTLKKQDASESFGLLILGSPDARRFSADLATDILERIGETASAALTH